MKFFFNFPFLLFIALTIELSIGAPPISDSDRALVAEEVSTTVENSMSALKNPDIENFPHGRIKNGQIANIKSGLSGELRQAVATINEGLPGFTKIHKIDDGVPVIVISGGTWNAVVLVAPMKHNPKLWTFSAAAVFSKSSKEFILQLFPPD